MLGVYIENIHCTFLQAAGLGLRSQTRRWLPGKAASTGSKRPEISDDYLEQTFKVLSQPLI
jgi:hypothetical protein